MTPCKRITAAIAVIATGFALTGGAEAGPVLVAKPFVSVAPARAAEGDTAATSLSFEVSLASTPTEPVAITVRTAASGLANAATPKVDFLPIQKDLVFAPGTKMLKVNVPVKPDTIYEGPADEVLELHVVEAPPGAIVDNGEGRILDNDPVPAVSVGDVVQPEGTGAPINLVFPVTLSNASQAPVKVDIAIEAGTAAMGDDWIGQPATLELGTGQTAAEFVVSAVGDAVHEEDETFAVAVGSVSGGQVADGRGTATLVNDDQPTDEKGGDAEEAGDEEDGLPAEQNGTEEQQGESTEDAGTEPANTDEEDEVGRADDVDDDEGGRLRFTADDLESGVDSAHTDSEPDDLDLTDDGSLLKGPGAPSDGAPEGSGTPARGAAGLVVTALGLAVLAHSLRRRGRPARVR